MINKSEIFYELQNVNDRDEQDARPMLYDPIQGGRTSKGPQYLATFIGNSVI